MVHVFLPFTDVRVGFTFSNITAYEGDGVINVTLELIGEAQREVSVLLLKVDGTATG